MNPIEQGFVTNPIDWKYSSARNYTEDETILKIDKFRCYVIINYRYERDARTSENSCLHQQGESKTQEFIIYVQFYGL